MADVFCEGLVAPFSEALGNVLGADTGWSAVGRREQAAVGRNAAGMMGTRSISGVNFGQRGAKSAVFLRQQSSWVEDTRPDGMGAGKRKKRKEPDTKSDSFLYKVLKVSFRKKGRFSGHPV